MFEWLWFYTFSCGESRSVCFLNIILFVFSCEIYTAMKMFQLTTISNWYISNICKANVYCIENTTISNSITIWIFHDEKTFYFYCYFILWLLIKCRRFYFVTIDNRVYWDNIVMYRIHQREKGKNVLLKRIGKTINKYYFNQWFELWKIFVLFLDWWFH